MIGGELNNPIGFGLLREADASSARPFPLGRAGSENEPSFLKLLRADRPAAQQPEPMLFPRDPFAADASPVNFNAAPRSVSEAQQQDELREAAEQLVATTFIMPLFDQLRDDPLAAKLFHGGQAENVFGRQLDQTLSDRIAGGAGLNIVDAIYNEFAQHGKVAQPNANLLPVSEIDIHG